MNPAFRFFLAATGISLMSMVDSALAGSAVEGVEAADKVILEAGEIDSSTVPVGSYVVVIHGQGERHPVSGEWEQFVTSRGYVYSVDPEVLTLFRKWDGGPEWIEVDRIQTLVLTGSHSRRPVEPVNEQVSSVIAGGGFTKMPKAHDERTRDSSPRRIANKLAAGAAWGLVGASVSGSTSLLSMELQLVEFVAMKVRGMDSIAVVGGLIGAIIGYPAGTAVGVNRIDPDGSFLTALAGSGVGYIAASIIGPDNIFESLVEHLGYMGRGEGILALLRRSYPWGYGCH